MEKKEYLIFIGKHVVRMLLLLFFVSAAAFTLISVSPIDPLQANVGQAALGSMSQEQIAKLQAYGAWANRPSRGFLHGHGTFFGETWEYRFCIIGR